MSNIYIQEPPAAGKVLLKTSAGEIDIELWTKEAPKACRNFIQLCLEGYYNGTIFHRLVPDFIVQGGDPNGDGTGGESIYGAPFKDEFHSRLRFNRRGLVASANAGKDDNGSQFFFTLGTTPELQNKHTIFGKVTGETIFNMLKLAEGETDGDDKPLYPKKIVTTEVLINPFTDIEPRQKVKDTQKEDIKESKTSSGVKNFGLLSFGEEAEEDEEETTVFRGKPKSTHDLLDDPKLSRLTSEDVEPTSSTKGEEVTKAALSSIREKLKAKDKGEVKKTVEEPEEKEEESEEEYYLGKDRIEARKKQAQEIRDQIKDLKREMAGKKKKEQEVKDVKQPKEPERSSNEMVKEYEEEQDKYRKMTEKLPKKGQSREQFTLSLLKKFQNKLSSIKEKAQETNEEDGEGTSKEDVKEDDPDDVDNDDWLAHKLHFENKGVVLAKDASTKGDDWFDIYDPRNPLNKRKREQSKVVLQSKTKRKE